MYDPCPVRHGVEEDANELRHPKTSGIALSDDADGRAASVEPTTIGTWPSGPRPFVRPGHLPSALPSTHGSNLLTENIRRRNFIRSDRGHASTERPDPAPIRSGRQRADLPHRSEP